MRIVWCRIALAPLLTVLLAGLVPAVIGKGQNGPTPTATRKPTSKEDDPPSPKPTRFPTTAKPTRTPTTAKPTKKPTTAKPTLTPTGPPPTLAPTLSPTVVLTPPPPVANLTTPVTSTQPLLPGVECEDVPCTGTIYPNATGIPQALDLLLLFDSTGSMAGTIDTAKVQALALLAALRTAGMTNLQAAVADHKDYIGTFTAPGTCGSISSGGPGDYVWKLDQAMTSVDTAVQTAIAGLTASGGGDGPEAYLSALYHSYTDGTVGWRGGGVPKVVVLFSDNVPHTCTSVTCPNTLNSGIEPGADLILGNGDDLTVDIVIAGLQTTRTTVFQLGPIVYPIWQCMTGATGGAANLLGTDISTQIVGLVTTSLQSISALLLEPCTTGDSAYLRSVTPALYHNVTHSDGDQLFSFNATVCPPSTATTGKHPVRFCLKGDGPTLASTGVDCDVK